jgi:hypothetical protein
MSINPVSIASAEAFGRPTIIPSQGFIDFNAYSDGIASAEAFGRPAIISSSAPGNTVPLYTVFINGVNRNAYIKKPSIRRHMAIGGGSRATSDFTTYDRTGGGYRPTIDETIDIFEGTDKFFGGTIVDTVEQWFRGTSGLNEVHVQCMDYGTLLDRRVVGKFYTLYLGGIPVITIDDIVKNFLDGTGITYDPSGTPGADLGEQLFNYVTAAEALNQIHDKINADYYVDFWKVLRSVDNATGWGAAPYTISDNDGNFDSISVQRSSFRRVNRQGVRNSQSNVALWTDTITAFAGQTSFQTTYFQEVKPYVTVDGVQKTVVEFSQIDTEASDFYYINDGIGIFHRGGGLSVGQVVVILYPSRLPPVYWAEDLADIALHGKLEAVEEVKDVYDSTAMLLIAQGLLARGLVEPREATIVTRRKGWEPGQLLTINTLKPPCAGPMLIESVDSEETVELGQPVFRHTIRANNSQLARTNRADNFVAKLIERTKQAVDRVTYKIGFTLAETIEGLTNPGLSTGLKPPIRVADKDGVLRDASIYFKSVDDGTLTTVRCVVDIYRNGVSVFPGGTGNKLLFPAGATAPELNFFFSSNPLAIDKGDVFTMEVLEADPLAMDGVVELVVLG